MNTNRLCLTLINPNVYYDLVRVVRQQVNLVELGNDLGYIASCNCGAEYSESIDTHTASSIDSNESPTTDEQYPTSLYGKQPKDHFTLTYQCYPDFAFQQPNKRGCDDYSIGSWADSGFHESFAVETVIPSSNEDPTEEYDEDYWKERAIEIAMQDERYSSHSFNNTSPPSIDRVYSTSVDTHPHPMNALTNQLEGTSRRSIRSKNPNSADKRLPSIDTPVSTSIDSHYKPKPSLFTKKNMSIDYDFLTPDEFGIFRDKDGHARAMDGRILQVSREDIADILQLANGPDNLFMQQRSIPDEIGSHQSCRPVGQASIDKVAPTSFDRVTLMSLDKAPSQSIDRRYECGRRAYDVYRARKFRWEQKDEYGVYRDESGYARSVAGEMIPVTKDNIRKILERASLFEESHLCLPEHATSFTLTKLAPEIYTKDEINEMMRTKIESMQHTLEKEATTSPSIDANKATSIDIKPQTSRIPAEPESLAEKKD
ncbi:unnamed protein product [Brassica oleracea]